MAKPALRATTKQGTNIMSLEDALASLEEDSLIQPSFRHIVHIANRCSKERNASCALRLHSYMQKKCLEAHDILGNKLVCMLVDVGSIDNAQIVFDQLPSRTESSWDSLIKGYFNCGLSRQALTLYYEMQEDALSPTAHTFVVLLKACGQLKDIEKGSAIHAQIVDKGLLRSDVFIGSALVDMYAKCGLLEKAHEVFEELPHRDVVIWNALIAGYAKHECGEQALDCFRQMQLEGVTPNAVTFTCSLKACGSIGAIHHGKDIHAEIDRQGLLPGHLVLGSALVDMYARCGFLEKAQKVHGELSVQNLGAWNALIAGYVKHNRGEEALTCFEQMLLLDVSPNAITFICTLKACGSIRALDKGRELHVEIDKKGLLKRDPVVGSTLVDMYVHCGFLTKAREVFDELPIRTVVSWNSLISGYVEHEHGAEALTCLEQMQSDGLTPNVITYISSLKACGIMRDAGKGQGIHSEIARTGLLEKDLFVGSTLVDMYVKCGRLAKAQEVFLELPFRTVVAWNALIGGYAKQERGHEALVCLEQMLGEGVLPDAITFTCSLKACAGIGAADKGREIHAEIVRKGLVENDSVVGSSLVDMYANCGLLLRAQEVFNELPAQNLDAWNSLISGYVGHECSEEAMHCFEQMLGMGVSPDAVTLICSLKACGSIKAAITGMKIHAEIEIKGFMEPVVGCALVDMYAKCGLLESAHEVFGELSVHDTGSWNALIAGYVNQEQGEGALNCFQVMRAKGVPADAITYACTLKACGSIGAFEKGCELHAEVISDDFLETDFMVGNALVDMYAKFGLFLKAQEVFDKLLDKDAVSWNALIGGYVKHNQGEEALICFEEMQHEGTFPDAITFTSGLKACGIIGAIHKAIEIQAETERQGFLESDIAVGNAVVDMYAKCCCFSKAKEVFRRLPSRDVVSWNTLIAGYAKHGYGQESLNCFEQMQLEGVRPDATTFACSLKACGSIGALNEGREIHAEIEREGLLGKDDLTGNALVDMYAKCGLLAKAQDVFDNLPSKSAVSWNALIAAYVTHMHGEEALKCFEEMQREGVSPNAVTFLCSLKACGSVAASDRGRYLHAEVERQGLLEGDVVVGNAIIDMYAKCGILATADEVFEKLPSHGIISWNALIGGYAQLGESEIVFNKFDRMIGEGIDPDAITFVSVLNVCCHAGLIDEAQIYFEAMIFDHGITPIVEHHTCMVDLLGRSGQEDSAMALMMELPFHPDIVMWCSVLGACRKWSNVELGQKAFEHVVGLDDTEAALYICMSNIYADAYVREHLTVECVSKQWAHQDIVFEP